MPQEGVMTDGTIKNVRFWYGIFLSVFTVALGVAFLAAVSDIYFGAEEGAQIFTRENMNAHMFPCLIVFCVWVAAVVAGFVLSVVMPIKERKKYKQAPEKTFARLRARMPQGEGDEYRKNLAHVVKSEKIRLIVWCACAVICVALGVTVLCYVFDPAHFETTEFNSAVLNMAKLALPCIAVGFLCCIAAAIVERESAKRALPYLKNMIAAGGKPLARQQESAAALQQYEGRVILGVRIAVAAIGVALLIWGIFNGGADDVFIKAINICTECIGLG